MPLTWDDFKGKIDTNNKINAAITTSGISKLYKKKGDTVYLSIKTKFYKYDSWIKLKYKTTEILKHEQGHFDITEIFALRLRKLYLSYKFNKSNPKNEIDLLFNKNKEEESKYQDLYDKETNHHKTKMKQLEWGKKIAKELKELEAYNNTELKIILK